MLLTVTVLRVLKKFPLQRAPDVRRRRSCRVLRPAPSGEFRGVFDGAGYDRHFPPHRSGQRWRVFAAMQHVTLLLGRQPFDDARRWSGVPANYQDTHGPILPDMEKAKRV